MIMAYFENIERPERALLVSVDTGAFDAQASIDELEELAHTAGAEVLAKMVQKRDTPDAATFIGSGRIVEIKTFCRDHEADLLVFDSELTPSQQRNIEKLTDVRVIDRTMLILDIFAARARSSEGKLQVELAQLKYACRAWAARARSFPAWAVASARAPRRKQAGKRSQAYPEADRRAGKSARNCGAQAGPAAGAAQ